MRKIIFLILTSFSLVVLIIGLGFTHWLNLLGYQARAGIRVTAVPKAVVMIDGVEVGETPYQNENLLPGEYQIKLTADNHSTTAGWWQSRVKLNAGTLTVVNRELGQEFVSFTGETLTLQSGTGVMITSTPNQAEVEIDGQIVGQTPLVLSSLPPGEHNFFISHQGFLKRNIRAILPVSLQLYLDVDLAIIKVDLQQISTPQVESSSKLIVKKTPTGFLRVRDKPSLNASEVGRVEPGESVTQLEELSGWFRVRLEDGKEGYVSGLYVQKQS